MCREELRELFSLDTETSCSTADLLADFPDEAATTADVPLLRCLEAGKISFIYCTPPKANQATARAVAE